MPEAKLCPCGQPLHYLSKTSERYVQSMVDKMGEFAPIHMGTRAWLVSRHYIALHGLRASDLPNMPFTEICPKCRKPIKECPEGKCG